MKSVKSLKYFKSSKYFKACKTKLTKKNKEALVSKCMRFYNKWYDNAGYIPVHTKTYFPNGIDPDYTLEVEKARKGGRHWLDGISGFKIGSKTISTDKIKKTLGE